MRASRMFRAVGAVTCATALSAAPAWAADVPVSKSPGEDLAWAVMLVLMGLAIGALVLIVRTILPPLATLTDEAIGRLSMKRLLLCGVLPLIGTGLIARGVEVLNHDMVGKVFGLLLLLPVALLTVAGLLAAVPRLGRSVLGGSASRTPLACGLAGGLVLGLGAISMAWQPLGSLVGMLFASWCLGAGLGTLIGRGPTERPPVP